MAENKKKGSVHAGHRGRLRKRFLAEGATAFEDHQLLELLLFYSVPRADTNALAHRLLNEFGSIKALFSATPEELQKRGGIGATTAALLSIFLPLRRRMDIDAYEPRVVFSNAGIAGEYAVRRFCEQPNGGAHAHLLCLDGINRLIGTEAIPGASFSSILAQPCCVAEAAMRRKCARVILVCALARGEKSDEESAFDMASGVAEALARMSIRLSDVLLLKQQRFYSCAEHGVPLLGYDAD